MCSHFLSQSRLALECFLELSCSQIIAYCFLILVFRLCWLWVSAYHDVNCNF
jgi:hypothetical protein